VCTAAAPDAVLTVRTYGDTSPLELHSTRGDDHWRQHIQLEAPLDLQGTKPSTAKSRVWPCYLTPAIHDLHDG
jgi:hypothetical protein